MPSFLKQLQDARAADRADRKSKKAEAMSAQKTLNQEENLNRQEIIPVIYQKTLNLKQQKTLNQQNKASSSSSSSSSSSKGRHNAHEEFQRAMAMAEGKLYTDHESLPSYESSLARFKEMYSRYSETAAMDTLRAEEYGHLEESSRVCLDYCGLGLFSHLQQVQQWECASFALSNISVNLCSHALFGAAEDGTVECDIRKRIMEYLNIHETDYSMVFTASRGASFKLLADAYPFNTCGRLITMYDYESESVGWMVQRAKEKGAKICNASFKRPSLRIVSTKLRKILVARRRRRGPSKGLFVFPVQSRVSGAKYSYQWMSLAQQNKWHVLLDASAIGPKDMDSLGLSLFRPDFIIASFYKVFGRDPSGFGCLFIKNSAIQSIQDESGAPASGIVRIIPFPILWSLSEPSDGDADETNDFEEGEADGQEGTDFEFHKSNDLTPMVASFSGPMLGFNRYSPSDDETTRRLPRIEGVMEEDDDDSSVCDSVGEVTHSPVCSEDGRDNLLCIDIGPSPFGTASHTSISEDRLSGPFISGTFSRPCSGPICSPVYDGCTNPPGTTYALHNPLFEDRRRFENGGNMVESKAVQFTKGSTNGKVKDDELSLFESGSEDFNVVALCSSKLKTSRRNIREVELLDPGKSPFTGPGSASRVNHQGALKHEHESFNVLISDPRGKIVRSRIDKVFPASVMEESSSGSLARSDRDVHEVDNVCIRDTISLDLQEVQEQNQGNEIEVCDSSNDTEKEKLESKQKSKGQAAWYQSESAIRRETEGDFRLLGRRNSDKLTVGRSLSPILQDSEELDSAGGRGSFDGADHADYAEEVYYGQRKMFLSSKQDHEETRSDNDDSAEQEEWDAREPEVVCRSLDHADMLGLNKTTLRLRYLINWLISALLQLRHPGPQNNLSLVHLYGPEVKYDRGASVAFNLYDCHGKVLHPELVQMLADKNNISVSIGFLRNVQLPDNHTFLENKRNKTASRSSHGHGDHRRGVPPRIEVVTAALSVLSNFEDVYRMWVFVAKFLDADFVSKEIGAQAAPMGEVLNPES